MNKRQSSFLSDLGLVRSVGKKKKSFVSSEYGASVSSESSVKMFNTDNISISSMSISSFSSLEPDVTVNEDNINECDETISLSKLTENGDKASSVSSVETINTSNISISSMSISSFSSLEPDVTVNEDNINECVETISLSKLTNMDHYKRCLNTKCYVDLSANTNMILAYENDVINYNKLVRPIPFDTFYNITYGLLKNWTTYYKQYFRIVEFLFLSNKYKKQFNNIEEMGKEKLAEIIEIDSDSDFDE